VARRLRFVPEQALVEVTARTVQRRFLLRPTAGLREIFVGILARAAALYDVDIHAFVVLSTHLHCLLTPATAHDLAGFMRYLLTNLSKEAGRLHRWRGALFERRYQAILVTDEELAQAGRLRYLLAHGVKESLVDRVGDWPGAHCAESLATGSPCTGVWFDRRREWVARERGEEHTPDAFATHYQLALEPLPCWRHLPPERVRELVAAMVAEIEQQAAARHHAEGTQPLGITGVLRQNPHRHPPRAARSPAILVHAATRKARRALIAAYHDFVGAFREAAARLAGGCHDVVFPDGSFPPPLPFCRSG
jgi:REP element-mobilizing transposase RayT